MHKLKLDIEALHVESFTPGSGPLRLKGTVRGRANTNDPLTLFQDDGGGGAYTVGTCIGPTFCCPPTWKATCADTCLNTCADSCDGYCAP